MSKGKQVYFTKKELEALKEFWNKFEDISPDEDTYAYWLNRVGSAFYKILNSKEN